MKLGKFKAGFDEILRNIRLKPERLFLIKKCVFCYIMMGKL